MYEDDSIRVLRNQMRDYAEYKPDNRMWHRRRRTTLKTLAAWALFLAPFVVWLVWRVL